MLTFVVIGGGPTGVELAGAIAELARKALVADFRKIQAHQARVLLIEAGPGLLPTFPERLSRVAMRALERLGVEVRLGAPVTACGAEGVMVGEEASRRRSSYGPPASPHRPPPNGLAPRAIAPAVSRSAPTCRCPTSRKSS